MPDRSEIIRTFLRTAGWQNASRTALAGDASPRRYDRLWRAQSRRSAVLMDAPPELGNEIEPFLRVAASLGERGLGAPEILASDNRAGLILLEDLGDDLFAPVCAAAPESEHLLYDTAVDVLLELQTAPCPSHLAPYSTEILVRESGLLTQWYLPTAAGQATPDPIRDELATLVGAACGALHGFRRAMVLRDFHAENLIWLPDRDGVRRVGLLDFQDALCGHPAYDLVSLLEDARRDTSAALRTAMTRRFLAAYPGEPGEFRQAMAVLGAQRNLKIIGIFARLCLRDAKPKYVAMIPRVWAHLENDLRHPALADLKTFIHAHVPPPAQHVLQKFAEPVA